MPASTFWSIRVGLIPRVVRASRAARSSRAISRASGPCDRAKAAPPASASGYQAILPSRRVSQYQTVAPGLSRWNVRRTWSGRCGRDQPKASRHPGLDDDQSPGRPPSSITTHLPRRSTPLDRRPAARRRTPRRRTPGAGTGRAPRPRESSGPARAGRSPAPSSRPRATRASPATSRIHLASPRGRHSSRHRRASHPEQIPSNSFRIRSIFSCRFLTSSDGYVKTMRRVVQ